MTHISHAAAALGGDSRLRVRGGLQRRSVHLGLFPRPSLVS
jgi:hypothetical protein